MWWEYCWTWQPWLIVWRKKSVCGMSWIVDSSTDGTSSWYDGGKEIKPFHKQRKSWMINFFQTTGDFIWTDSGTSSGSAFSCDNDQLRSKCSNVGPSFLHVINLCAVVAFYALIILKLVTSHCTNPGTGDNLKSISKPLILLIGAYFAFLLPLAFFESCFSSYTYESKYVRAGIASW